MAVKRKTGWSALPSARQDEYRAAGLGPIRWKRATLYGRKSALIKFRYGLTPRQFTEARRLAKEQSTMYPRRTTGGVEPLDLDKSGMPPGWDAKQSQQTLALLRKAVNDPFNMATPYQGRPTGIDQGFFYYH